MNQVSIRKEFASKLIPEIAPQIAADLPQFCTTAAELFAVKAKVHEEEGMPLTKSEQVLKALLGDIEQLFAVFLDQERQNEPNGIVAKAFR
jgi:hypothetical protein